MKVPDSFEKQEINEVIRQNVKEITIVFSDKSTSYVDISKMLRNPLRSFRSIGPAASTARCARPLRGLRTSSGFTQCLRFRSLRLQAPALRKAAGPFVEVHITEKSGKETTQTTLRWFHIAISDSKRTLLGIYH